MIRRLAVLAFILTALLISISIPASRFASAQASPQAQGKSHDSTLVDEYQTLYRIDHYKEVADSGEARGENIYFYKCWMCHNRLTKGGPDLKDLYKHSGLVSGEPVDDETVAAQVKNGGGGMPSFRTTMTEADVADVVSYLRSGKCCYEADEPPANPRYLAEKKKWPVQSGLTGGTTGVVRTASGEMLEGIKVQLIAPNDVRTTVMTNEAGRYEFPVMQSGKYTLRIATPVPYKAYVREGVQIERAGKIEDIVLEKMPDVGGEGTLRGALPPVPEIESQLSGAEMLWNLSGTDQDKVTFVRTCGAGCHSYQQILRNRFDERSWRIIVDRMIGYSGNALIVPRGAIGFGSDEEKEQVVKWLTSVRGPESKDPPLRLFPRSKGASTRAVITEFELPRKMMSPHDVYGDLKGNIWYSSHKSPYVGVLDSHTGIIKEYKIPITPGALPGTHAVRLDKQGIAWFSENWSHKLARLDPRTSEIKQFSVDSKSPINAPGIGNFTLAPDGSIWTNQYQGEIQKIDPETGKVVMHYPLKKSPQPYEDAVSWDGRFWAGGSPPGLGFNFAMILDIRTGKMLELNSGDTVHSAARGGFDPYGNAWFGGRDGVLAEIVNEIDKGKGAYIRTYVPPTPYFPYTDFYDAMPDKNGDIWAGLLHGQGFLRFSPRTGRWLKYDNPEPMAHDRRTWVDNSTTPVTVWYVDFHTGYIVRIQPLE